MRRLLVKERHDRLAECHALDREESVPAGVQLIDDEVCGAVALKRLGVVKPLHDLEVDIKSCAGGDDVIRALALA